MSLVFSGDGLQEAVHHHQSSSWEETPVGGTQRRLMKLLI